MNYQNILCIGDSQTFGARSYGCYPLSLASALRASTPYEWRVINWSHNGYKCRDLWLMLNERLCNLDDCFQACLLIGTNDVGENSDLGLFCDYYRQCLLALSVSGYRAIYCGEIPPVFADGHVFFSQEAVDRTNTFNAAMRDLIEEFPAAQYVALEGLSREDYEDPVHFNEQGNSKVAKSFAGAILKR